MDKKFSSYLIVKINDLKDVMKKLQAAIYAALDNGADVKINQMPFGKYYVFETIQNHVADPEEEGFITRIKSYLKIKGIKSELTDKVGFDKFIEKLEKEK